MALELSECSQKALLWITEILSQKRIPFQISGGLAAKIYGSPRSLNDIDIDIPEERFPDIDAEVRPYITFGPAHHKDEKWDLYLMTLNYHGQDIDIGGSHVKIYDDSNKSWVSFSDDLNDVVFMSVAGKPMPVIPRNRLIEYKRYLNGDHQKIDISSI